MSDIIRKKNQWYPDHKIIPKKTSDELAEDVEAFLKNGGEIVNAPSGVTGQPAVSQWQNRCRSKQEKNRRHSR